MLGIGNSIAIVILAIGVIALSKKMIGILERQVEEKAMREAVILLVIGAVVVFGMIFRPISYSEATKRWWEW